MTRARLDRPDSKRLAAARLAVVGALIAGLSVAVSGATPANAAVEPPVVEAPATAATDVVVPEATGPGAPDAPVDVAVANINGLPAGSDTGKVTVTWGAAPDNGSPVTKYVVTYGVDHVVGCETLALECVVSGLTPGLEVAINVTATNDAGVGPASADVLATPLTQSRAPLDPTATAGEQSAVVSWTAPAPSSDGGSPITSYEVRVLDGRGSRNMDGCSAYEGNSCIVVGLSADVDYSFGIVAVNAMGRGELAITGSATPWKGTPPTAPSAPTALSAVAGDGQVTASWAAPASTGGTPIKGYTVTATPGGDTCVTKTALTCTVLDLTNGTPYTLTATATNAVGTSPASEPSASVTPATVPSAPTGLAADPGDGQVTVSWAAPASTGGSSITGYTVTASPGGRTCVTSADLACIVQGLTNASPYTFTVTATNAVGPSPTSDVVGATPAAPPTTLATTTIPPTTLASTTIPTTTVPVTSSGDPTTLPTTTSTPSTSSSSTTNPSASAPSTSNPSSSNPSSSVPSTTEPSTRGRMFVPLTPTRVLDTRGGARVGNAAGTGAPVTLTLAGRAGLPNSGIGAVALNVTVVDGENPTTGGGYVTVYPCGTRPDASNLNFTAGQTIPNSVIAPVSATGTVCFYVYGSAHLLADVSGYIPTGPGFTSLTPTRVLDTRGGNKVGNAAGTGAPVTLTLAGKGGLPASGIGAVAMNVTVVDGVNPAVGGGYVTVYPCGTRPDASNLNFSAGQTIPNSVIAPVSATGTVCFYVYGSAHLLADISGYVPTGPGFTSLTPTRVLDTRGGAKVGNAAGPGAPVTLTLAGRAGLPNSRIDAVALNVTVVDGENPTVGGGYVTVYPCGTRPDASNLNFTAGQTIPNSVIAPVSASGTVCFSVYGTAHLLADVSGYFSS